MSGGNFHGQAVALALDVLAIAMTNLATIAERRIDRLVHPDFNQGLPPFLSPEAGVNSGFMMAQVTAASLASECKVLSHPASVDTIPTDGNKEDVVPMAMGAAWKLRRIVNNVAHVLAIELMCGAQAIDFRAPLQPAQRVARLHAHVRELVPRLERDRVLSGDIATASHRDRQRHVRRRDACRPTSALPFNLDVRMTATTVDAPAGARPVRAPRGSTISCKGWQQEAALRMLMNNLDPEVAERPDDLVVYGGTGKAARNWECFDAIVRSLRALENDETLLVQSGKPVAVFRTHATAPRVLIANSNLVGRWATWDVFRELERKGLTMYGQMTAGSWIYIGSQGILQGTFETFGAVARQHFDGSLAGRFVLSAGLGGMGGAQPLAATMQGAAFLGVEVDEARIAKRVASGYCDRSTRSLDEALAWIAAAQRARRAAVRRARGQCRGSAARARAARRHAGRAHRSDERARHAERLRAEGDVARRRRGASSQRPAGVRRSLDRERRRARRCHARRCASAARSPSTTATTFARWRTTPGSRTPSIFRASFRRTCARCSAKGRVRSAGSRSPAIPRICIARTS